MTDDLKPINIPPLHEHEHGHTHTHSHEQSIDDVLSAMGTAEPGAAHHSHAHTHQNTKAVLNRLSRVSGHLNAVRNMLENERDCFEVLIQLAAVRSALNGICEMILRDHIEHCIVDAVRTGDMDSIDDLNKALKQLLK